MTANAAPRTSRRLAFLLSVIVVVIACVVAYLKYARGAADHALDDATVPQLQKITAEQPGNARAFYYLGQQFSRARKSKEALAAYTRAAELDPDDEDICVGKAGAANAVLGTTEAFHVMDAFLKSHPNSERLKQERASLLTIIQRGIDMFTGDKNYPKALNSYRFLLAEEPDNVKAQLAYGLMLDKVGRKEEARHALESALKLNSQLAEARTALARIDHEPPLPSQAQSKGGGHLK